MSRVRLLDLVLALLFLCSHAQAITLQYFTGDYWDYRGWTWHAAAARFTVPSDQAYRLDWLEMRLCGDPSATLLDVTVRADVGGAMGGELHELPGQSWNPTNPSDEWNIIDLSSANLVFAPGSSFHAGYVTTTAYDELEYADIGIFTDADVAFGRSRGINIHHGPEWEVFGGEELFFRVGVTPEPATLAMVAIGVLAVSWRRRNRAMLSLEARR